MSHIISPHCTELGLGKAVIGSGKRETYISGDNEFQGFAIQTLTVHQMTSLVNILNLPACL